jgi:hypothetical protein
MMFKTSVTTPRAAMLLCSLLLAGCAQIPRSAVDESTFGSLSCVELAQQADQAQATKAAADKARSESWHAVLPFIVVARYAQASSAGSESERRSALLAQQMGQRQCAGSPGNTHGALP